MISSDIVSYYTYIRYKNVIINYHNLYKFKFNFHVDKGGEVMEEKTTSYMPIVITLVSLSFILGTSEFVMVGILPEISSGINISITKAGALVTIFAFVYAIGTPIITALSSKANRYRFLLFNSVIFIIGNFLNGISSSYGLLLGSRIITAVVSGTLISLSLAYANEFAPKDKKAKIVSFIFSGFSIASVIGVPIGTFLTNMLGWRSVFFFITGVATVITIALAKFLPPAKPTESTSLLLQLSLLKDVRILLGITLPFFNLAGTYAFYTYLTPTLEEKMMVPTRYVSIILVFFGIAAIISNLLSGWIADKFGLNKMPFIYVLHASILFAIPFVVHNKIIGLPVIFSLCVMMYLINSPIQMHFMDVSTKDYPQSLALAACLNSVFANFGISLGSFCGGQIVKHFNMQYIGFGGTVFILFAAIFSSLLIYKMSSNKHNLKPKHLNGIQKIQI